MKVLRFSLYIINTKYKEHSKNKSGYGRSVWDICRYSSINGNEEYVYTYGNKKENTEDNIKILSGELLRIVKNIDFQTIQNIFKTARLVLKFKGESIKSRLAVLKYTMSYGYIKKIIGDVKPDVIHIHGLTHSTLPFLEAARDSGRPYMVTLHGLNMDVVKHKVGRDFEIEQITKLNEDGIYITVIGSGMIKTIVENCKIENVEKIVTINHGMDESSFTFNLDKNIVKNKYGLGDEKVILSVGSLSERRNQICLIRSIALLSSEEIKSIKVYIVGDGPQKNYLQNEINNLGLSKTIELLGHKNHQELSELYTIASLTAVLSKVEGFGRPILESFVFGVPVVAFSDLDAVQDLYKDGCMYLINDREDESVSDKIIEVLNQKKDSKMIKDFASTKTWTAASCKYQEIYHRVTSKYINTRYMPEKDGKYE